MRHGVAGRRGGVVQRSVVAGIEMEMQICRQGGIGLSGVIRSCTRTLLKHKRCGVFYHSLYELGLFWDC